MSRSTTVWAVQVLSVCRLVPLPQRFMQTLSQGLNTEQSDDKSSCLSLLCNNASLSLSERLLYAAMETILCVRLRQGVTSPTAGAALRSNKTCCGGT